jgi:hypothetical protein
MAFFAFSGATMKSERESGAQVADSIQFVKVGASRRVVFAARS